MGDHSERPLAILPGSVLTEKQLVSLATLAGYDLSPVRQRLLNDAMLPSTWVDEAIFEFRRYLGLQVVAPGSIPMFSKPVDEVWHACLLHSRLYADLCQQVFGYFLHHEPATNADDDSGGEARWLGFVARYEALYGPPGRLWLMGRRVPS